MSGSNFVWAGAAMVLLLVASFGGWMYNLPAISVVAQAPLIPTEETDAILASFKPTRLRPMVAIIGLNHGTETTDYLVPAGILRRSDVADVVMLATGPEVVQLFPALKVKADSTITEFDATHTGGADYVVVPAMSRDDDPAVLEWIKSQAKKGAVIIGICAGAKVVAAAGLLDGKRATTHWYYRNEMFKRYPTIQYLADRRMVADRNVVTTTGITASLPTMLTLIEAIAGRVKAEQVAHDVGLELWDARHASASFAFTRQFAISVLLNSLAFWSREEFGIPLEPGMDEVSLALVADAWSRTYRSHLSTFGASSEAVTSRYGIRVVPDQTGVNRLKDTRIPTFLVEKPVYALDLTLDAIAARYGKRTSDVVASQLEYRK